MSLEIILFCGSIAVLSSVNNVICFKRVSAETTKHALLKIKTAAEQSLAIKDDCDVSPMHSSSIC